MTLFQTILKKGVSFCLVCALALPMCLTGAATVEAAGKPKIYLSPSKQDQNFYSAGGTVEMIECNRIADAAKAALERCGFDVRKAPMGQDMYASIQESNNWGADMHIPIHTNAKGANRPDHGTLMLVYDERALPAAKAIQDSVASITMSGLKQEIEINRVFAELNSTKALSVYTEVEYHDNTQTAQWIISNVMPIGEAIARGVCNYYGVTYQPPLQWKLENGTWYADQNGTRLTGWCWDGKAWYYLNEQGVMQSGWIPLKDKWYYTEQNGAMVIGWKLLGGKWYYFQPGGDMAYGWLELNGKHYYFDETNGSMLADCVTPDGYTVDGNGVWQQGYGPQMGW